SWPPSPVAPRPGTSDDPAPHPAPPGRATSMRPDGRQIYAPGRPAAACRAWPSAYARPLLVGRSALLVLGVVVGALRDGGVLARGVSSCGGPVEGLLGGVQLGLAVGGQLLTPLPQEHRLLERHLAGLDPGDERDQLVPGLLVGQLVH